METLQKNEKRPLIILGLGISLVVVIILFILYTLYQVSKDNLIGMWNNSAIQMSYEVSYYLNTPRDAVNFTAQKIAGMIEEGCTNKEIKDFLINETAVYSRLIDSNYTGIYGYCRGEYLDGSGWIEPDDYVATERPWYIEAKNAKGEVAFVKPYYNLQTFELMMSVSKLLSDGESVISMDIFLDSVQKLEDSMLQSQRVDAAMLIDKSGMVVAHSDHDEIGKEYLILGNEYEKELVSTIFEIKNGVSSINSKNGRELVFCQQVNNDWYSVLILSEKEILGHIKHIYLISGVILVAIFMVFFAVFSIYMSKHKEAGELHSEIRAISDIYTNMELIDIRNGKVKPIRESLVYKDVFNSGNKFTNDKLEEMAEHLAAESSRSMLVQFMDFDTLPERIGDLKTISHEYLDRNGEWNRMHFIVVERETDGSIRKLLWAIQSIDEDKKRQELFKNLAETDALTHILNRSGGESRIYSLLEKGKTGMLLLFDADHFKYVNDTYGHDIGDKVIIALANCLKESFRDTDVVFRLGGDEFVAFASGVENEDVGRLVVNRLFANIDKISFEEMSDWKLRISVGAVLCSKENREPFATLYQNADKAMYESKQHEGNYLTFYKL